MRGNKKKTLALVLALALPFQGLVPVSAYAMAITTPSAPSYTVKTFGGSSDERAMSMAIQPDGSYVAAINTRSYDRNLAGVFTEKDIRYTMLMLVKYDSKHIMQWKKSVNLPIEQYGRLALKATSEGGYIAAGVSQGSIFLLKLDANGNQQWLQVYKGGTHDDAYDVIESEDGHYVITGSTRANEGIFAGLNSFKNYGSLSESSRSSSAFIMKVRAADGVPVWTKVFGGNSTDSAHAVAEMDGSYVVMGQTASSQHDFQHFSGGDYDLFLAKFDKLTGDLLEAPQSYEGSQREDLNKMIKTQSGELIITGTSDSVDGQLAAGSGRAFLAKYNSMGSLLWSTRFAAADSHPMDIVELGPDQLAVAVYENGESVVYLVNTTDPENVQFTKESLLPGVFLSALAGNTDSWYGVGTSELSDGAMTGLNKGAGDAVLFRTNYPMTDQEAVTESANDLNLAYAHMDSQHWVTQDIILPSAGDFGTTLAWESNHPALVIDPASGKAVVNRPASYETDVNVTLTLTASLNGQTASQQIVVTVKKQSLWQTYAQSSETNPLRTDKFAIDASTGTLYTAFGMTINKKTDGADLWTELPLIPANPEEEYSEIVGIAVSGDGTLYASRYYYLFGDSTSHYELIALQPDQSWTIISEDIPEVSTPDSSWGSEIDRSFGELVVDGDKVYQNITYIYRNDQYEWFYNNIIARWDGTSWADVSPAADGHVMSYTVHGGFIYSVISGYEGISLHVGDGTNTWVNQPFAYGQDQPAPRQGASIVIDAEGYVYVLDSETPYGQYVWKGQMSPFQQGINWTSMDDSYRFHYPKSLAVYGGYLYLLEGGKDSNIIRRPFNAVLPDPVEVPEPETGPGTGTGETPAPPVTEPSTGTGETPATPVPEPSTGTGETPVPPVTEPNTGTGGTPVPPVTEPETGTGGTPVPPVTEPETGTGGTPVPPVTEPETETGGTPVPPVTGPGTGTGSGTNTPAAAPSSTLPVVIGGQSKEIPGSIASGQKDGRKELVVTIDSKKLQDELNSGQTGTTVMLPVSGQSSQVSNIELNAALVKAMEAKSSVLEIRTDQAIYILPAKDMLIDQVIQQFGSGINNEDVKMTIRIAEPNAAEQAAINSAIGKQKAVIVVPGVSFEITASYNGTSVSLNSFKQYIERRIPIPAGVDPSKITTGVVVDPDGVVRHVPTRVIVEDGIYYAEINSLTNSLYSVVWNPIEFADVAGHWAKEAVNDMGSRMVISGVSEGVFEPKRDISRAEFAAILVRGLGLKPASGKTGFTDVQASDWFAAYVNTATKYELINGYGKGVFAPDQPITREEAMTMVARAARIASLTADGENAGQSLSVFEDGSAIRAWAQEAAALCVDNGLVKGKGNNKLAPKDNITRAEVATMVRNLLQKADLI
ncbi:hypothetical protein DNH61_24390 [Paenibacillus sambharensis]|uniref:SLH domain-containing protein n=1 Tax=Paenibacillus sambharensis TaxID=1803190 RepID=A0A2W1KZT1_9BACL|nr:S-layer homology domain-containing protein [Paenibacillus sambharensis]PZD93188.1 hypothetical protein DNH61_24390 [Paenibacillus sambharensis]